MKLALQLMGLVASGTVCVLLIWSYACADQADSSPRGASKVNERYIESGMAGGVNVQLFDAASGSTFVRYNGMGTTADDGLLHHIYENASATEVLDLIEHPGGTRNSFAEVRVLRPESAPLLGPSPTKEKEFRSSRGVRLGMEAREVIGLLGKPHKKAAMNAGRERHEYRCDESKRCPVLEQHTMPSYSATLIYAAGKLIDYRFGFDYP